MEKLSLQPRKIPTDEEMEAFFKKHIYKNKKHFREFVMKALLSPYIPEMIQRRKKKNGKS